MSYWRRAATRITTLIRALARTLARGIGWTEARLRAGLRLLGALVFSALLLLARLLLRGLRALAARLVASPRTPAQLRQGLVAFQAHDFARDAERLALWWGDWRHEHLHLRRPRRWWDTLTNRYGKRQMQRAAIVTLLLVTVLCGPLSVFATLHILPSLGQSASAGQPNHPDPNARAKTVPPNDLKPVLPPPANTKAPPAQKLLHTQPPAMQPGKLALSPTASAQFLGSDGLLEVDVPAGAVTPADVTAAGGALSLQISQIAPASGSIAGGSGLITFGMYLVQVVDAHGYLSAHGLRQPATFKLHITENSKPNSALDLVHTFVIQDGSLPEGVTGAPTASAPSSTSTPSGAQASSGGSRPSALGASAAGISTGSAIKLGAMRSLTPTVDTTHGILTVPLTLGNPSTSVTWNTHAAIAAFGAPDPFNVELSSGSLTGSFPIALPPAPGGILPPVLLSYDSAEVSERHNVQASAPWVGEGWHLALGAVTWTEENVAKPGDPSKWQSRWQISDPFGMGSELIPSDFGMSTFYDDTPYSYCVVVNNNCTYPGWPKSTWRTADGQYTKIVSYVGPLNVNEKPNPPCFRAWLTNGVMEEFGCTSDSLQYYYEPGNGRHMTGWNLDLIADPEGNQIHLTYQQDMATYSGVSYPRDTVLNTIEYDDPTCHDAQHRCTTWNPLVKVLFNATHTPARLTNSPSGCNTGTNLRCDNPLDLSGSSGVAAPQIQNTFVLNEIDVQTRNGSGGQWNQLRDYQLSYEQSGPTTITDPSTGKQESTSGRMLLTKFRQFGTDGTTALPTRTFGYTLLTQYYEDTGYHPNGTNNCGPAWNTGSGSGCLLWSQSYDGNSYYLSSLDNGMGLHSIFAWDNARSNKHGVNGGGATNTPNPLYCNTLSAQQQATYPCNAADDHTWSRATLTSRREQHYRAASSGNVLVDSQITYLYFLAYPLTAQQCSDCVADFSWGNQNDADYLDYYNGRFMGFVQVSEYHPDGSKTGHRFYATEGWGIYNTSKVSCFSSSPCHTAPFWHLGTAGHGMEYEASAYATDNLTLLKQDKTQYTLACPPPTVSATPPYSGYGDWDGNRVSGIDHYNPGAVCATLPSQRDTYTFDGGSPGAIPQSTTTYSYETNNYQRLTDTTSNSNGGGAALGSPTTIKAHTDYIWDDAISATLNDATGRYIVDTPAQTYTGDTGNTNHYSCTQTSYDGQGYLTGQQSGLTTGHATTSDHYRGCGSAPSFTLSGQLRTTASFDVYGQPVASKDPDANAGVSGHVGCTVSSVQYTTCLTYDGTYATLPVSGANALNQTTTTGYTSSAAGGFGFWPTSTTDPNGQTTTYAYDALGRMTSTTLPGEGTGLSTTSTVYTVWCSDTGAQAPCVEIDQVRRLDSSHTVTARSFYDGLGRLVETRTSAPGTQDVVRYAYYDVSARLYFTSNAYFVSAYTGAPGAAAFATPDVNQAGASVVYDALGRTTSVTDPLSHQTQTGYAAVCNVVSGDSACYEQVKGIDALNHQSAAYSDAWGRLSYSQRYTGNSGGTYALYATTKTKYDANGKPILITHPDGTTTTAFTFDNAGFQLNLTDPDRGGETYSYDQNGNVTQTVDARGASGTVYAGYDGLNRQLWRNSTNGPTGAYVTYSYDSTAGGNKGVGRLTGETFNAGASLGSGSYSYTYDARGQTTGWSVTLGGTTYPFSFGYNDAGQMTSLTYSDGEVLNPSYDGGSGWLATLSATPFGGSAQNLLTNIAYTGAGGAVGSPTGANVGGTTYSFSASYDLDTRLSSLSLVNTNTSITLFSSTRGYDAASNVTSVNTTLAAGTDNQAFCYDEQNRLVWAGATGTPSCGSSLSAGSLTSAQYTQTFTYDTLDRLTSGPTGAYTYGDGAHKHAATSIGSSTYTASYDAAGDMTCRAPTGSQTCSGTPTGQLLTYDNEGRTSAWQNAPSNPTSAESMAYDGAGQRVALTVNGGTPTYYVGGLEEISGGTLTKYLAAGGGLPTAMRVGSGGALTYLASDGLRSISEALDGGGAVTFQQLFTPYGSSRYSSGSSPTSFAFTGQRADGASGLDYYTARYYDPTAGQFGSADTVLDGLDRYGYVGGNPTTVTDPSGHVVCPVCEGGGEGAASLAAELESLDGVTATTDATTPEGNPEVQPEPVSQQPPTTTQPLEPPPPTEPTTPRPPSGRPPRLNPNNVRFTQAEASNTGQIRGSGGGSYTVADNIQALQSGQMSADDLPPIRVFRMTDGMKTWDPKTAWFGNNEYTGDPANLQPDQIYTLDNRRLAAFQRAGNIQSIPVVWEDNINVIYHDRFKFSTENFGRSIFIRGLDDLP